MIITLLRTEFAEDYCENEEIRSLKLRGVVGFVKMRIANDLWLKYHGEYDNSVKLSCEGYNRNKDLSDIRICHNDTDIIKRLIEEFYYENEEGESYYNVFKSCTIAENIIAMDNDDNFYIIGGDVDEDGNVFFSFISDKKKRFCFCQIDVETIANDAQSMDFGSYKTKYYDSWANDLKLL